MIYGIHSFIVGTIMRVFFKKIYLAGLEKLPLDKPLMICSNHPTGFWEPCLFACTFPFRLHFLTRGDLFRKNSIRWFLRGTNQIPIFRSKDGFSNLKENTSSMSEINSHILKGSRIVIFVEGSSGQVKYLRPLKKGFSRMAFDAYKEDADLDLQIVPVGVTFNDSNGFRSDAMIQIGDPIPFRKYIPAYQENEAKAKRTMTRDLKEAIEPLMIQIKDDELLYKYEQAAKILRNEMSEKWLPVIEKSNGHLKAEQKLVKTLESLDNPALIEKLDNYTKQIETLGTSDEFIANKRSILLSILGLILLAPVALAGIILNFIPTGIAFFIATYVIPKSRFWSSLSALVRLGLHWYIYFPIMTVVAINWIGWPGIFFGPLTLFAEWVAYRWFDQIKYILQWFKRIFYSKEQLSSLKEQRKFLVEQLDLAGQA